jgi:ATP synthase protein I
VENDLRILLKKVAIIDLIVGCMLTPIIYIFLKGAAFIFVVGLAVALVNFVQNGVFSSLTIYKTNQVFSLVGYVLRMAFVLLVAMLIFKQNQSNIIPFILGYSAHYISIFLYGLSIKNA